MLTFHIESIILFIGSSGIFLYNFIVYNGSFFVSRTCTSEYFFLKNLGLAIFSIDAAEYWDAIALSTISWYSGYVQIKQDNCQYSYWYTKTNFCFQKNVHIIFSRVLTSFILCKFHKTCDILHIFSFISFAISFSCSRSDFPSHLGNNTFKKTILCALQNQ